MVLVQIDLDDELSTFVDTAMIALRKNKRDTILALLTSVASVLGTKNVTELREMIREVEYGNTTTRTIRVER